MTGKLIDGPFGIEIPTRTLDDIIINPLSTVEAIRSDLTEYSGGQPVVVFPDGTVVVAQYDFYQGNLAYERRDDSGEVMSRGSVSLGRELTPEKAQAEAGRVGLRQPGDRPGHGGRDPADPLELPGPAGADRVQRVRLAGLLPGRLELVDRRRVPAAVHPALSGANVNPTKES